MSTTIHTIEKNLYTALMAKAHTVQIRCDARFLHLLAQLGAATGLDRANVIRLAVTEMAQRKLAPPGGAGAPKG